GRWGCSGGAADLARLLQQIRRALIAREQVRAVVGRHKGLQRLDAGQQTDEIILIAKREHRIDQVVTDAGFALLDLEAVGEEVEELVHIPKIDGCLYFTSKLSKIVVTIALTKLNFGKLIEPV